LSKTLPWCEVEWSRPLACRAGETAYSTHCFSSPLVGDPAPIKQASMPVPRYDQSYAGHPTR
ncbi:MAG: hypothetical protein ACR2NN_13980, partial [Bryobacteraceae bacterium]